MQTFKKLKHINVYIMSHTHIIHAFVIELNNLGSSSNFISPIPIHPPQKIKKMINK